MSTLRNLTIVAMTAVTMLPLLATGAEAKIRCDGPYQITGGGQIRTPYCEDNYLADVARGYGIKVAKSEIRHNFNAKRRVCEVIGHDNRVAEICTGMRPEDRTKIWIP